MDDRQAIIHLDAIEHNVRCIREISGAQYVIGVVKANAYGHGAVAVATAALAGGVDLLGVADIDEGVELRRAGISAPILCWLHSAGESFENAVELDLDVGVSSPAQVDAVILAARTARKPTRVHLKVDTGLHRNGLDIADLPAVARRLYGVRDVIHTVGIFTHLANASVVADEDACRRFDAAIAIVRDVGLQPLYVHAAASSASFVGQTHYNTVRVGLAMYGISAAAADTKVQHELRPVMELCSRVVATHRIGAGEGVGYDYAWRSANPTRLALVPLGYADGVPRSSLNRSFVRIGECRFPVVGRVSMDQIVVDVGDASVAIGDDVTFWGGSHPLSPTVAEWASWAGTIPYEVLVHVGTRVRRVFV